MIKILEIFLNGLLDLIKIKKSKNIMSVKKSYRVLGLALCGVTFAAFCYAGASGSVSSDSIPEAKYTTEKQAAVTAKRVSKKEAARLRALRQLDSIANEKAKPVAPQAGSIEAVLRPATVEGFAQDRGVLYPVVQDGKYYLLMPTAVLGKDFLVVNRLSRASALVRAGFSGYAGDQINESMIRFRMSDDGKNVFLEDICTRDIPRDTAGVMYNSLMRSNLQAIAHSFDIKGANQAKDTVLVEITDFLNGDSELISFSAQSKDGYRIGNLQRDKSYVKSLRSYPSNTEIRTVKSYLVSAGEPWSQRSRSMQPATFEINSSFVMLPTEPMRPRYADPRVGYFTETYTDYDINPQGVKDVAMITRYKLEPRPEDMERYLAGELVEPAKPIIYYIDPTTPAKWVPYLIQGVDDWQKAFEAAGFKNAVMGKVAPTPEEDSTWSLEDARFSAIVYKPSDIPNASGPHVRDPRSGQIIESHINWYHNVMQLLKRWYMVQAGPNDPQAWGMEFPDSLMGQLIRFVSSHEVGHTLGLRHNFGATSQMPVDSLRNAEFLAKHGHTPSIMDYSRFNYVVQPEDSIPQFLLYPRIQDYDHWAIEYGYRYFPGFESAAEEKKMLSRLITERTAANPRLWFGNERSTRDPRSQAEDLSDNQMVAGELGIRNLKRVMANLPAWTMTPDEGYFNLYTMHNEVIKQFIVYNWAVAKWVGGVYESISPSCSQQSVYRPVEKSKQKEAMQFLDRQLFTTPSWIMDPAVLDKTGMPVTEVANTLIINTLDKVLSEAQLIRLAEAESQAQRAGGVYTVAEFYNDLNSIIFRELYTNGKPDAYRRLLQKNYVSSLMELAGYPALGVAANTASTGVGGLEPRTTDVASMAEYQLSVLQKKLATATSVDPVVKAHYQYLSNKIKELSKI